MQTTPLENGTKVLYGAFDHNHNLSENMDYEATIIGYTHMDDDVLHYVLESLNEEAVVKYFIRTHAQVRLDTKLHDYISIYIEEELERMQPHNPVDIRLVGRMGQLRCWIREAVDAHEGGAR